MMTAPGGNFCLSCADQDDDGHRKVGGWCIPQEPRVNGAWDPVLKRWITVRKGKASVEA